MLTHMSVCVSGWERDSRPFPNERWEAAPGLKVKMVDYQHLYGKGFRYLVCRPGNVLKIRIGILTLSQHSVQTNAETTVKVPVTAFISKDRAFPTTWRL